MPVPIGLILAGAQIAGGMIASSAAKRKAEQLSNSRPQFTNSPHIDDNMALAKSELSNGMSSDAEKGYEQNSDRMLSTSIDAILKGGGSVNNVGEVFNNSEEGRQRLALMKDNLRLRQVDNLVRAQQMAEQQRQQKFQFNGWAPWADQAQATAQARQQSQNQIWQGVGLAGSELMRMQMGNPYADNTPDNGGGNYMQGARMNQNPVLSQFESPSSRSEIDPNSMSVNQSNLNYPNSFKSLNQSYLRPEPSFNERLSGYYKNKFGGF